MVHVKSRRERQKADVLLEISQNPGLYADDVAERLRMPTALVGELIDEGILENDQEN